MLQNNGILLDVSAKVSYNHQWNIHVKTNLLSKNQHNYLYYLVKKVLVLLFPNNCMIQFVVINGKLRLERYCNLLLDKLNKCDLIMVFSTFQMDRYVRSPKVYESYLYYEKTLKSIDELVALLA
jgi:hypothetical protein